MQEFSIETRHAPLWETALKFGPEILRKVIAAGVPKNTVINVNFPACAPEDVLGVRVTRQGKRNLGFLKVDERRDGRGNPYFWIGFERLAQIDVPAEGTDLAALGRALCFGDAAAARSHRRGVFGSADDDAEVTAGYRRARLRRALSAAVDHLAPAFRAGRAFAAPDGRDIPPADPTSHSRSRR